MSEQLSPKERATEIAKLNDEFRRAGPTEDWVATVGAVALSNFPGLVQAVIEYDDFNADIDPHREHDMGRIVWDSEPTYWKIDYYDQQREYGEDPLSQDCRRVLTLLLTSEY
jgi:hypothetical protein